MSADKMAELYIETLFARHFAGSGRFELPYQGKSRPWFASNAAGCSIGRLPGLAPLRISPT
jgi:hypothetical protein